MRTKAIIRALVLIAFATLCSAEARGQIRITEYMYDSTSNGEFVELTNLGGTAVDMTGWGFDDSSQTPSSAFDLSAFGSVAPGESVIITDQAEATFRAAWGLGASVKILGGSGGVAGLGRSDEINIYDASDTLVDRLTYNDAGIPGSIRTQNRSGWPCAAGIGANDILKWFLSSVGDQQGSVAATTGGAIGSPGTFVSVSCPNAPVVANTIPLKKGSAATLPSVSVTFSTNVTGVVAGSLTVNGSAATSLSGSGAGPYVFSGYAAPAVGSVAIALASGAIVSQFGAVPFAGDSWTVAVGVSIVINELNYHPHDTNDPGQTTEFVELYNAGATNVDLGGWSFSGITYVIPASTIINAGAYRVVAVNSAALQAATGYAGALQWTSGALSNGGENISIRDGSLNVIDSVTYSDGGDWPSTPDGSGPSLELINPGLPNDVGGAWRASLVAYGTPGAVNSNFNSAPSPIIYSPSHSPSIPAGNASVLVKATVIDDGVLPPTVELHYRVDSASPGAYTNAAMFDDGLHGDGAADDHVFGATMPGLASGSQYDFYFTADDGSSLATFPTNHASAAPGCSATGCQNDINPSCFLCQTLLCKFSDEVVPTDAPVYHILVTQTSKNAQEALACNTSSNAFDPCKSEFDATFIDNTGKVYYNVSERYRGQSSITLNPRSYRVDFPSNNLFTNALGFPVQKMVLNGNQPVRQKLGFDIFRAAGAPASAAEFVRLRYTGINYDTTAIGSNGFTGLYACIEQVDNDFLDSQDGGISPSRGMTSDGNLYRGENTGNFDWRGTSPGPYRVNAFGRNGYSKENNEEQDVWTDLIPLLDAMNNSPPASYVANVAALVDEDEWAQYFAIHNILANKEGGIYRDTGDDYYLYFNPPGHPDGYNAKFITWDTDSILRDSNTETIWRTGNNDNTIATIRSFLRHNAFAPIFVKQISDQINGGSLSITNFNARIDAMLSAAFFTSGGSTSVPATRQQFKDWYAARVAFINNEIVDNLTVTGIPASPYTSANPVIALSGQLNQAGTHNVTVNGQTATFSVYAGTWSHNVTLWPGINKITVKSFDRGGGEMQSITNTVIYDPSPATPGLRLTAPNRMVDTKTLTLKAEILDASSNIDWRTCTQVGAVSATRLSDGSPVPTSITVFETLSGGAGSGGPSPDSIRFYNGIGSVSITLDQGAATPPGDILVTVTVGSFSATRIVEVLDADAPGLFKNLSGTLSGPNLTWGPADGVIHLTGTVTVSSGTLTIQPGTLVMADPGPVNDGVAIVAQSGGVVSALGTRTQPIFFFATAGPPAMALPQTQQNNDSSWRGIYHENSGTSNYSHVFFTGAGNAVVSSHPRPPILRFNGSHGGLFQDCVIADSPGMGTSAISGSSGNYTFRRCLFSRVGIGGEWLGTGSTMLIEDSWFTRIGRAPEPNGVDGDILHVDRPGNTYTVRRSVLTDCGDDMIDHSTGAQPVVENCIIYDCRDKVVSIGPLVDGPSATITMTNCLVFNAPGGIRCAGAPAYLTNCTLGNGTNVNGQSCTSVIQKCILWTNSADTCCGTVNHTIVGNAGNLGCGTGNLSTNPLFVSTSCNYSLQDGSPGLTAGPGGTQIGWLGFPFPTGGCVNNIDCNDSNPCTTDTCNSGTCSYSPVSGCCLTNIECDDGNACTTDACSNNVCTHTAISCNDNNACTTDSCNPQTGCFQTAVNCDDSNPCTVDSCDSQLGCQHASVSCPQGQACNPANGQCQLAPVTATFQDGVASYTGTQDTYLDQAAATTARGAVDTWRWDTEDPAPNQEYGLIRFDNIFGSGPGQIPPGSQISSATLTLVIFNGGVTPLGTVNEVLVDWAEGTTTWSNFGGDAGAQTDEYNTTKVADAPIAVGTANITVTSSLQSWLTNPSANRGWIFVPANNDGVQVRSAEYATVAERPKLTVIYTPPVTSCTTDGDCSDGLFCNGVETCNQTTHLCESGTAPNCNDNIACTSDSCNEATDTCDHLPNNGACSDGNPCTDDLCVVGTGCTNPPNTATCDDGNACTTNDTCSGGNCISGPAANCDDGIACTTDACNPGTGCTHTDNCTGGQTCNHTTGLCSTGPVTTTFQQNVNGYTGTADTYIDAALGSQASVTPIVIDGSPVEQVLIRFDGIFGSGPNQIPAGSTIVSATLTLRVGGSTNDESANSVSFHRLLHAWNVTDVWAAYGVSPWNAQGGIQADGTDAVAVAEATTSMSSLSTAYPVSVTGSVQAWAVSPTSNYGWAILPSGTDGLRLESAESATAAFRPLLSVTYTPPFTGCNSDAECSDGLYCNGVETCNQTTHLCESGTAPDCNDNIACTTDSCNEATDSCDHVPNNGACSDGLPCTDDACVVGVGCTHTLNPAACDDGNLCTDDACDAGVCVHSPHDCNDNDACTTDTCAPGVGCQHAAISCDDGISCTVDLCNPVLGCQHVNNCSPGVEAVGPRYLRVTPPTGLASVALRVESASIPCLPKYIDATGHLVDTPVFQSSAAWGTINVGDRQIIPGTLYDVRADVRAPTDPENLSSAATVATWQWGNVDNTGDVSIFDIVCVLDGFQNVYNACSLYGDDLQLAVPDRLIDMWDILAVIDAFQGLPYPDATPCDSLLAIRASSATGPSPQVTLVPRQMAIAPGATVAVDVFISQMSGLRAYQLAVQIGGGTGPLLLEGAVVDANHPDYVFAQMNAQSAIDLPNRRLANVLFTGSSDCSSRKYLTTLNVRATASSRGQFTVSLVNGGQTIFVDQNGQAVDVVVSGATISVFSRVPGPGPLRPVDPTPVAPIGE